MDRPTFETRLREQGYGEVTMVERPANVALEEHTHPFEAHALILEGEIEIQCAGEAAKTYRAGEVFQLAKATPHTERYGPAGVRYVVGRR